MPPTGEKLGFLDPAGYATWRAGSESRLTPPVQPLAGTPCARSATLPCVSPHENRPELMTSDLNSARVVSDDDWAHDVPVEPPVPEKAQVDPLCV